MSKDIAYFYHLTSGEVLKVMGKEGDSYSSSCLTEKHLHKLIVSVSAFKSKTVWVQGDKIGRIETEATYD